MALGDGAVTEVSKLEGSHNYNVWSFKVKNLLKRDNLWDLVMMNTQTVIVVEDVDVSAEREWRKKRNLSIINLAVKDCVVPYILDMVDHAMCWERLKNMYATKNNARHTLLRRKLTNLRMEEGSSISIFL